MKLIKHQKREGISFHPEDDFDVKLMTPFVYEKLILPKQCSAGFKSGLLAAVKCLLVCAQRLPKDLHFIHTKKPTDKAIGYMQLKYKTVSAVV